MTYIPKSKYNYDKIIIHKLMKEFGYKSIMEVPKLKKIVVNRGLGYAISDKKLIDLAVEELTIITGQKAVFCLSKKDEAGFKLRKNMPIGCMVTLRKNIMYEFLDRLIIVALPRVRDFNGIKNTSFDGNGNYNLGVSEQIIFPEIDIDKVKKISGMNISFITSAKTNKESRYLLLQFGLPFKN